MKYTFFNVVSMKGCYFLYEAGLHLLEPICTFSNIYVVNLSLTEQSKFNKPSLSNKQATHDLIDPILYEQLQLVRHMERLSCNAKSLQQATL